MGSVEISRPTQRSPEIILEPERKKITLVRSQRQRTSEELELRKKIDREWGLVHARRGIKALAATGSVPWGELMELVSAPELRFLQAANDPDRPSEPPEPGAATQAQPDPIEFIFKKEVADLIRASKSTVDNYCREGDRYYDPTFPQPVYQHEKAMPRWVRSEVERWKQANMAKRGTRR